MSGQGDSSAMIDQIRIHRMAAESALVTIEHTLDAQIEKAPEDRHLLEMLDIVAEAHELILELEELLAAMQRRDALTELG